ncbi:MAG: histidine triad nucleotide-binding protein [Legionellales bacterium]|nr:histidine triad nucleotide-binding protein [Legionellales bacterium]
MDCLFCKIVSGEIKSQIVYEDEHVIAFRDIDPKAPTHILITPRQHIANLNSLDTTHQALMGHILIMASQIARDEGHAENGYRLVINCNLDGGQTVFHLHCHILGGRTMHWPPG